MSILWCGGEDIDFPNGNTVSVTVGSFRSGYARCAIFLPSANGQMAKSTVFSGGAITSAWVSFRFVLVNLNGGQLMLGFGLSGTSKGLFVGSASGNGAKLAICKYDGTTITQLATETGTSLTSGTTFRIDMQVISYGASATVNVYLNGALLVTFSGDVTVSGMTNFDSVFYGSTSGFQASLSEIIVADEDPRGFPGLVTLALTGAGTTDNWTASTFGNINGTTISDASPMSSNTNAQDSQFNVTDLPTGSFVIKAVKIAARMAKSSSPAVTQVKMGYNDGGTVAFGTGATKALTTAYATYEQLDLVNPNGGAAFTQGIMNALQLDVQSLT